MASLVLSCVIPDDILQCLSNVECKVTNEKDSSTNHTIHIPDEETEEESVELFTTKERSKLEQMIPESVVNLKKTSLEDLGAAT